MRLIVFARAPVPGRVKQRLAATVGQEEALRTHVALIDRTLDTATRVLPDRVELWVAGPLEADPLPRLARRYRVPLREQYGPDLGARMAHALQYEQTPSSAMLIGCDIPALDPSHLHAAASALLDADVVLGPAEDGGYWLIGWPVPQPQLFERIDWGTDRVMQQTLARAAERGLNVSLAATLWDVDDVEGWRRWRDSPPLSRSRQGSATESSKRPPCPGEEAE